MDTKSEISSAVLLERIEKVSKLITVEGHFSEIYDYKDYYFYDLSPFRKKALIRVKAKVSMGYDFQELEIVADEESRTISIGPIPEVEILSIDHDLDYYDISEGTFNTFKEADYTKISREAKEYIRHQASFSNLKNQAILQGNEMIKVIQLITEQSGWKLKIHQRDSTHAVVDGNAAFN